MRKVATWRAIALCTFGGFAVAVFALPSMEALAFTKAEKEFASLVGRLCSGVPEGSITEAAGAAGIRDCTAKLPKLKPGQLASSKKDQNYTLRFVVPFVLLGQWYEKVGDFAGETEVYTRFLSYDPDYFGMNDLRGQAYLRAGNAAAAVADFDMVLKVVPTNPDTLFGRGRAHTMLGETALAHLDFSAAIESFPQYAQAYVARGKLYEAAGNVDRAAADYRAAVAANPTGEGFRTKGLEEAHAFARVRLAALGEMIGTPAPTGPLPAAVIPAGKRVALVIGNSAYAAVTALPNPKRDADAVAGALRGLGFEVTVVDDADRNAMAGALQDFAGSADGADWAMVYYAGHGIEVGGTNYLIPTDARLRSDRDVQFEAIPLDQVLAAVEGAKKLKLVVLDSCRENPFASQMKKTVASRSIGRGFNRVEPETGTLVVYAAKDGQIALDGEGARSPFAEAFLGRLATPGVEITKLFRLVRDDVMAATGQKQEPFVYGSLPGSEDYYFVAAK